MCKKQNIEDAIKSQLAKISEQELSSEDCEKEIRGYLMFIGCTETQVSFMGGMGLAVGFSVDGMELHNVMSYSDYMLACKVKEECVSKALPTLQDVRDVLQSTLELYMEIFSISADACMPIEKIMEDVVAKHAKAEEFLALTKPLIALKKAMSK